MNNNLSIYIHFPFCAQKCNYCNFYSIDDKLNLIPDWTAALLKEIDIYSNLIKNSVVRTIYFGGGSPNLLPQDDFQKIIDEIQKHLSISALEEFTFELNPSDVAPEFLNQLKQGGVDRISMGAQSFSSKELAILGRSHTPEQIYHTLDLIKQANFTKINLDLIFGIPEQSLDNWLNYLENILALEVNHLSLYNLTYEPGTTLTRMVEDKKYDKLDENLEWQMYAFAHNFLENNGFNHYEISNWAKPEYKSIHNQVYWKGGAYLGLGPGAHSYYNKIRRWNKKDLVGYINKLQKDQKPPLQQEDIDQKKNQIERLFLTLRTKSGMKYNELAKLYNFPQKSAKAILTKELSQYIDDELIILYKNHFKLTLKGWFVSNSLVIKISDILDKYNHEG